MDASASTDASNDVNQPAKPEPWWPHHRGTAGRHHCLTFGPAVVSLIISGLLFALLSVFEHVQSVLSMFRVSAIMPLSAPARACVHDADMLTNTCETGFKGHHGRTSAATLATTPAVLLPHTRPSTRQNTRRIPSQVPSLGGVCACVSFASTTKSRSHRMAAGVLEQALSRMITCSAGVSPTRPRAMGQRHSCQLHPQSISTPTRLSPCWSRRRRPMTLMTQLRTGRLRFSPADLHPPCLVRAGVDVPGARACTPTRCSLWKTSPRRVRVRRQRLPGGNSRRAREGAARYRGVCTQQTPPACQSSGSLPSAAARRNQRPWCARRRRATWCWRGTHAFLRQRSAHAGAAFAISALAPNRTRARSLPSALGFSALARRTPSCSFLGGSFTDSLLTMPAFSLPVHFEEQTRHCLFFGTSTA